MLGLVIIGPRRKLPPIIVPSNFPHDFWMQAYVSSNLRAETITAETVMRVVPTEGLNVSSPQRQAAPGSYHGSRLKVTWIFLSSRSKGNPSGIRDWLETKAVQ